MKQRVKKTIGRLMKLKAGSTTENGKIVVASARFIKKKSSNQ